MNSVGIDLHRKRSHVAALADDGTKLLSRRIVNDSTTFLELLGELEGESRVALEATYGWEWLAELLEDAGYELHLAHPLRTKAIASARVKTDAVDAMTLAHLLRTDPCPRPTSRRPSCATCASCCATEARSPGCARRSSAASTPCSPSTASITPTRTSSAGAAGASSKSSSCARPRAGASRARGADLRLRSRDRDDESGDR